MDILETTVETTPFTTELAKTLALTAATTAGMMLGFGAVGFVYEKVNARKARKEAAKTTIAE